MSLRIVSGHPWTIDGRWVVIGPMFDGAPDTILFDPCEDDFHGATRWLLELQECRKFVVNHA